MRQAILVALLVLLCWATPVWAGGPPPMYVLVEKVVLEPSDQAPERIQIWGCFIRTKGPLKEEFTAPVYGFLYLAIAAGKEQQCREQWALWQKAAGSGKVVPVGCCLDADNFLTLPIRKPDERPQRPDGTYALGQLGLFGDFYGKGEFDDRPPVKQLLAFAKRVRLEKKP